jgi:hypothetical protein
LELTRESKEIQANPRLKSGAFAAKGTRAKKTQTDDRTHVAARRREGAKPTPSKGKAP